MLAGATGLTLVLGVGVAVGAVPRPAATETVAAVATGTVTPEPSAAVTVEAPVEQSTTETPTTEAPTTTAATTPPTVAAKVVIPAAEAEPSPVAEAESITPAAPSAPAGPTVAARANPSTAEVNAAIGQIASRIPFFAVATDAQARQFGDAVCTAFDQGNSYASVKSQVQQALSQLPLVTIKPADMDFAIRTAVQLFCPGYSSMLV
jgi:hypothetical protein